MFTLATVPDEKRSPCALADGEAVTPGRPSEQANGVGDNETNLERDRMSHSVLNSSTHALSNSAPSTAAGPRPTPTTWEPKFPFDLVVAYEDRQTRNRALHLYDHLAQQLLDDYDFQCSWWKFDHLTNRTLAQQAADAAADANMIVLSLHARRELLPLHQAWIEQWLPRRQNRKSALVVLLAGADKQVQEAEPTLVYLRRVARLAHMDFFNHGFDLALPSREISLPAAAETARLAPASAPSQQVLYHQMPTPRWGINE